MCRARVHGRRSPQSPFPWIYEQPFAKYRAPREDGATTMKISAGIVDYQSTTVLTPMFPADFRRTIVQGSKNMSHFRTKAVLFRTTATVTATSTRSPGRMESGPHSSISPSSFCETHLSRDTIRHRGDTCSIIPRDPHPSEPLISSETTFRLTVH